MNERVIQAFKEFSFKDHPFTEEEWQWYLNFHPAGLDTFEAGYNQGAEDKRYELEKKLALAVMHLNALLETAECRNDDDCDHCYALADMQRIEAK